MNIRGALVLLALSACNSGLVVGVDAGPLDLATRSMVPTYHRPSADACLVDRPLGTCSTGSPDLGHDSCGADSDCTAGSNGRCRFGHHSVCMCTYDTCFSDADCAKGTLCQCNSTPRDPQNYGNRCVATNCRVDADCGAGGYCSPSLDAFCGAYAGITAWHCHTAADTCVNNEDCLQPDAGTNWYCGYDPKISHWTCLQTLCAG